MPDGMTPENGLFGTNKTSPENNHEVEDAIANRMYYRTESLSSELISSAENPQELFRGLRQLEKQLEDGNIPFSLSERYTPPRELSIMYERADVLRMTPDDLVNLKLIRNYNPSTGEGIPVKRKYASLSLSVEENPITIPDERTGRQRQVDVELKYNFGTPEKRAEMSRAYDRAKTELEARSIMDEHIGLRLNLDFRDNLEGLVGALHGGRMPKFKADHLEAIFNMPDVNELATNPESRKLGDQVEEALFLNLVMLNSGNKGRMKDFLDRPGAKYLIAKLAKESGMTYDEWKIMNIGDVDRWDDDSNRDLKKTWRVEQQDGRRGALTKWGNISAWGGNPSEFGADKEKEFIEDTVGKLVGSIEASWLAATLMRVIGAYASEGYVALPNGKSLLPLGEGRYISGDDTGKFYAYMFNMKEGLKGRVSGLKDMVGKVPDMAMNLFDWAAVEMDDLPFVKPDGKSISEGENYNGPRIPQKRSIWDAWLGTAGGKSKVDLVTGKETQNKTAEEPYHRLGSLNFKSLEREFHGTFTIMQWLMGNGEGPTGVFVDAMKVDFKFEDFSLNNLKKEIKYIGIVMNPVVLTKGSQHLYDNVDCETIQENFFRNLMSARIRSVAFKTNILNQKVKLFNPGDIGTSVDVPAAKLVDLFVNEAIKGIKGNYKEEIDVVSHYIDDNGDLRNVAAPAKVVGAVVDNAKFEEHTGKITGKKIN